MDCKMESCDTRQTVCAVKSVAGKEIQKELVTTHAPRLRERETELPTLATEFVNRELDYKTFHEIPYRESRRRSWPSVSSHLLPCPRILRPSARTFFSVYHTSVLGNTEKNMTMIKARCAKHLHRLHSGNETLEVRPRSLSSISTQKLLYLKAL